MNIEQAQLVARYDERRINFDGKMNCRDLGGLPTADGRETARGRIYRSGRLSNLADGDDLTFLTLGIKQIFDLRLEFERERFPNRVPDGSDAVEHHNGYLPEGAMTMFDAVNDGSIVPDEVRAGMRDQYRRMATEHPEVYRALVERLLVPGATPLLFHCSGGKDRTGVLSAVLLRTAGVSREVVIADYLLTNLDVPQLGVLGPNVKPELAAVVGRAHVELIETAMDAVEQSFSNYETFFRSSIGIDAAQYAALIDILVQ